MPVRTVASQSRINLFAKLCFVCAGWCFLLGLKNKIKYALLSLDSLFWVGPF